MTRYRLLLLTAFAMAAPLAAQQPVPAQHAALDRIVAVIGDQLITRYDL